MNFDFNPIKEILNIDVEITESRENPLLVLELVYRTRFGQQKYTYPTKPKEACEILNELLKRKLIVNGQLEEIKNKVNTLEKTLLSYSYFRQ